MIGTSPIIVVRFQTQEIYCVRDKNGNIKEGGQDTIHMVYYDWAMQQVEAAELGEDAIYPIWRLKRDAENGWYSSSNLNLHHLLTYKKLSLSLCNVPSFTQILFYS